MTDAPDPYKILQVDSEAEDEVIQAAYRRLAQKYHPDLSTGQAAMDRMVAINAAWETIGDPARRAIYDSSRRATASPTPETRAASGGPAGDPERSRPASRGADPGSGGPDAGRREPAPAAGSGRAGPDVAHAHQAGARSAPPPEPPRPPEAVSRDWTPGRSTIGSGYDARTMRAPEGFGAAGPPPGNPSGGVVTFGRYAGWSIGEIGRKDLEYLEWLDRMPIGRPYRPEIDVILRQTGRRRSTSADATQRRGLFRRS
jgi:curved DNA-binding protein CbpA